MKLRIITTLLVFINLHGFSQADIESFQSATGSQYYLLTGAIDQSPTGANVSWDFTGLAATTTLLTDTFVETPPNSVIRTSEGSILISEIGLNTTDDVLSVTSALSSGIQLSYTNFAVIGAFPLSYGYSNTDDLEGTFTGPVSGNILNSSTIDVAVDAWGILKLEAFDGAVTRLKIVQNLNLLVGGLVPATGTQTTYFYYDANSDDLVFRSTRLQVPLANIDNTTMESLSSSVLSTTTFKGIEADLKLTNNPVKDILRLSANDGVEVNAISISDLSGRVILKLETKKAIVDVSHLPSGMYVASIQTQRGIINKRFIKQ
ncbi:T9SS type A sorting domain-containing protein [Algibacter mikhailovii]|uniref:Secretion system C-terminal sorting domain-containing protein n=1 Tax=Algibacter mikhailovii TaxID=425498 RepID=A0A918V6S5_9FLAO|nr:T9SS type A sorting domain-containing protein [Algibacter mikhailovii]GGZ76825.1 hypothetical protein GCM10007028_12560 [Algibacter mikhailovii]